MAADLCEYSTEDYCQLIAQNGSHKTVDLQEDKAVVLGRGPLTGITDKQCSREQARELFVGVGLGVTILHRQVEVGVDVAAKEITVTQLSRNPSVAGNTVLHKTEQCTVGPGAVLELPGGHNKYRVFFGQRLISGTAESRLEAPAKRRRLGMAEKCPSPSPPSPPPHPIKPSSQRSLLSLFRSEPTAASCWDCRWSESESLLVMTYGDQRSSRAIASFDLDGTIIDTKSGKMPFNTTPDDWRFWHKCVPGKLLSAHRAGYRIVVFTNQAGMPHGNPSRRDFQEKLQAVTESLGQVPMILFAAKVDNKYRKPSCGMMDYFIKFENDGVEIDRVESYYIGDAAGRMKDWKPGRYM